MFIIAWKNPYKLVLTKNQASKADAAADEKHRISGINYFIVWKTKKIVHNLGEKLVLDIFLFHLPIIQHNFWKKIQFTKIIIFHNIYIRKFFSTYLSTQVQVETTDFVYEKTSLADQWGVNKPKTVLDIVWMKKKSYIIDLYWIMHPTN